MRMTMRDEPIPLLEDYLRMIRPRLRPGSHRLVSYQLKKFFRETLTGEKSICDVSRADIEAYLSAMRARECATATIRDVWCAVRDFYEYLRERYGMANPAAGMEFRNYKRRAIPNVPSPMRVRCMLDSLDNADDQNIVRQRAMVELAYGSGLRRGELRRLDIEDIDFDAQLAHVRGKGGHERIVPLTRQSIHAVKEYLARRCACRGPLFVTTFRTARRLSDVTINWLFRNRAGIRPHLLRHACATHMLREGCDIRSIQQLLGHRFLTTTQLYTHINKADLKAMLSKRHPRANTGEPGDPLHCPDNRTE